MTWGCSGKPEKKSYLDFKEISFSFKHFLFTVGIDVTQLTAGRVEKYSTSRAWVRLQVEIRDWRRNVVTSHHAEFHVLCLFKFRFIYFICYMQLIFSFLSARILLCMLTPQVQPNPLMYRLDWYGSGEKKRNKTQPDPPLSRVGQVKKKKKPKATKP